ncbi:hypothetical protein KDI_54210 [Dictyobacter arantiisoli]|uniref:Uncharacterized protein n=1 Tax=Dictyobacter arantiisoli TaxID=2014874 RepID=A0A5A5TK95_9CHLR|nr:hypothetical protein KDI_54210 [Dictyobacter arantiisoli]
MVVEEHKQNDEVAIKRVEISFLFDGLISLFVVRYPLDSERVPCYSNSIGIAK